VVYTALSMREKKLIITLPNSHLRKKSQRIKIIDKKLLDVISLMKAATLDWEASREHEVGVALAAIQIDQAYRVVVIRNNFDNKEDKTFSVFINPEIIKLEGDIEEDYEGCLSVADIYGKVPRHTKVRVKALDEQGRELRVRAEGFLARVFQHEVDHTNGIMFVDHIKNKADAFYRLTGEGKLEQLAYEQIEQADIFRD
jgi:peptide deformylase